MSRIISERRRQANFQLIVITHDEGFLQRLAAHDVLEYYWWVFAGALWSHLPKLILQISCHCCLSTKKRFVFLSMRTAEYEMSEHATDYQACLKGRIAEVGAGTTASGHLDGFTSSRLKRGKSMLVAAS